MDNRPRRAMVFQPDGGGYWLVAGRDMPFGSLVLAISASTGQTSVSAHDSVFLDASGHSWRREAGLHSRFVDFESAGDTLRRLGYEQSGHSTLRDHFHLRFGDAQIIEHEKRG